MEQAWQSSVNNRAEPPAVHAPYTAPAKPAVDIQGDAQNFLAALDAAELEPDELDAPASRPVAPVRLTQAWRPPSPSHGYAMTEEQYAMHERLAMLQTGVSNEQPYRQAEAIEPPADDAALGEGVYAPTPDKALASVWDAQSTRAAHVQQFREDEKTKPVSGPSYTKIRGQEIVDKLRGWLVREGYTEDVYGLPPLVTRTFGEATSDAKNEQDEERRAKAIRRLDALYRHLSAPARPAGSAGDVMESWLEKNSE
ncbi:hypothetical protein MOBT1_002688 [Malassezia obtusa]|uniref:Uncharacterized protein n=1 Tax=Malassezia obtusa TaxID=76774 RepID=A0AAF0E1D3_9BASI|nr:hypothetical protein MOBT1_002688 [Malassezia obtusa]